MVSDMKIVLWGKKLHTDTYSYIQYGYYRAADYLGHTVEWYGDEDDVSDVDFSNSIFLTEASACEKMPLRKDCKYFIHCSDKAFKYDWRKKYGDVEVYNFIPESYGYTWPDNLERIDNEIWYHEESKTIITKWASDLLPPEIDDCPVQLYDDSLDTSYFIGTLQGSNINTFGDIHRAHGKNLACGGGWQGIYVNQVPDMNQTIEMVRNSYLSFDIREDIHFKMKKYYPCRVFKNISYGKWTGCNMPSIGDLIGDYATLEDDLEVFYDKLVEDTKNCTEKKMRDAMNFVRDNHTYINRLNGLLVVLK